MFLLLQYLEAVCNIFIHYVEQNIVRICVKKPLGNEKTVEYDLASILRFLVLSSLDF